MKFHLAWFSLTLNDLERSIQVTQVFNGLYLQIYCSLGYFRSGFIFMESTQNVIARN